MIAYKHDLYLIERTKLLEGIVCQSITFTNSLWRNYADKYSALTDFSLFLDGSNVTQDPKAKALQKEIASLYKSPVEENTNVQIAISPIYSAISRTENGTAESYIYWIYDQDNNLIDSGSGQTAPDVFTVPITSALKLEFQIGFRNVGPGTLNCTYYIQGVENRYPPKPYTITDCINRVLELAEPLFEGQNPRYVLDGVTYVNGEIDSYEPGSLAEKYDKIQAPEFTMTQCTLREQLKVIGGYIHAEPRLEYPNIITFVPYCLGTQAEIGQLPYIQDSKEQSLNEYCTEIVTNAQNLVNSVNYAKGVIIEPNLNYYKTVRTETVNVKLSEPISLFETQCPIYSVQKLMVGLYKANGTWEVEPVDITPFVFERHEYNNLSSYKGNYPYVKSYAVYYTQGEPNINGLFFKPETQNPLQLPYLENYAIVNILQSVTGRNDIKDLITDNFQYVSMQLTYIPVFSAMFSHGKQYRLPSPQQPFQTVYNQSENLIESSWYGEHIKGVSARLGNVEQTRTYKVKSKDSIPRVGQMIDDYYISTVATDLTPFYYKVTVGLTKDFNRISQYVGINSTKRVSEVSEKQAYQRNILIKEYICLGDIENEGAQTVTEATVTEATVTKAIRKMCGSTAQGLEGLDNPITSCLSNTKNKALSPLHNYKILLPVVSSAMGNTMTFCWSYKDNYSAGTEVTKGEEIDGKIDGFWQTDVPYCDYYGRVFFYRAQLHSVIPENDNSDLKRALSCKYDGLFSVSPLLELFDYRLRKDSREILNFNYCLEYVTDRQDLNIGSALASNNPLVTKYDGRVPKVYFFNKEIDKFITNIKELETETFITTETETTSSVETETNYLTSSVVTGTNYLRFAIPNIDFKSWAIAYPVENTESTKYSDEDGNVIEIRNTTGGEVLLSSNKSKTQYGATQDEVITIGLYA